MKVQQFLKSGGMMILIAMTVSYLITLLSLSLISFGLLRTDMKGSFVNVLLIMTAVISCIAAGLIAGKKMKTKRFLWGILAGVIYFILLCLIKVFLGDTPGIGSPHFLTSFLCCLGSGMLGGMLS